MKDKSLKILLGIIAVNLTLQTINQIGLFPTAYAQSVLTRSDIRSVINDCLDGARVGDRIRTRC